MTQTGEQHMFVSLTLASQVNTRSVTPPPGRKTTIGESGVCAGSAGRLQVSVT